MAVDQEMYLYIKKDELPSRLDKKFIYQKFISGQEYGLDILNDFNGRFISYCLKKKIEMRSGETDKAFTINNEQILKLSKKYQKILNTLVI